MKKLRDEIHPKNGSYKSLKYWKEFVKLPVYKNMS